jgi:inosose dehydratase
MKTSRSINRRFFLKGAMVSPLAISAASMLPSVAEAAVTKSSTDPFGGLKCGIASYTFRNFTLPQAIAMTRQAGGGYLTLKDVHLPMRSSPAERHEAKVAVEAGGLQLMGGGVIYMKNDEAEIKSAFDYARDAGMPVIVCSPDPAALDLVERMAKTYNLRIAIHNHGPGDQKYPSPLDVLRLVKDRDPRLGICIDVGHTVRIGQDPVAVIEECSERLYDFHIKDVSEATAKGGPVEVGKGVIDIVGVLRTLRKIKFSGHVALEYEANAQNPMPGVLESFAFMRGVLAAIQ